jgi:superfamily II DNA/RNA helicase
MPKDIADLADRMLQDPARVAVTPVASTVERITQKVLHVDHSAKPAILAQILKSEQVNRALVFTRTKHGADKVVKGLVKAGIPAEAIHGNKSQNHRERVLASFRTGDIRTLVATDIAARGIDVDGISHVVNFDLTNIPETYVHRIGRTARAGADGTAISLVAGADELGYLRDIERLIKITLPKEDRRTPGGQRPAAAAQQQRPARSHGHEHGRGNGKRHGNSSGNGFSHAQRSGDAAPGSEGPRRRRRPGAPNGMVQTNRHENRQENRYENRHENSRHEPARTSHGNGGDGIQGVAFLHRESRPAQPRQPKRNQRPHRS